MHKAFSKSDNSILYFVSLCRFILHKLSTSLAILSCIIFIPLFNSNNDFSMGIKSSSVRFVQEIYSKVTYPVFMMGKLYSGTKNYVSILKYSSVVIEENEELKKELQKLQVEASETKKLKELLKVQDTTVVDAVTVRVIANTFDSHAKTFNVNAGRDNGLKPGQILVNDDGLIGKIIDATNSTAKVLAVIDPNSKIPAIFSSSRMKSLVSGTSLSNDILKPSFVPKELVIENGEPVLTSGEGDLIPYGLLVGHAYYDENGKIYIKSAVNWNEVEYAKVLTPQNLIELD